MKPLITPRKKAAHQVLQSESVCCNLQSDCKLDFNENKELCHFSDCRRSDCKSLCNLTPTPGMTRAATLFSDCTQTPSYYVTGDANASPVLRRKCPSATMVHSIDFIEPPSLGTVLMIEGQRYVFIGTCLHRRRNQTPTSLLVWQTHCPVCGESFTLKTGLKAKWVNRRCPRHHHAGKPVAKNKTLRRGGRHG